MGFGPRSHREAAHVVSESFGVECVALELSDSSFYHFDTAFCPLPSGDLIYYPGAFSKTGLRAIEERVTPGHRVAIDHEERDEICRQRRTAQWLDHPVRAARSG